MIHILGQDNNAISIPNGFVEAMIAVSFPVVFGFIAWIVKENRNTFRLFASITSLLESLIDRVERLEGYHDMEFENAKERDKYT